MKLVQRRRRLFHRRHLEDVPLRVVETRGNGPPEHLAVEAVVPDLGHAEGDDRHVGVLEVGANVPAAFVRRLEVLLVLREPQVAGGGELTESPSELLHDHERVFEGVTEGQEQRLFGEAVRFGGDAPLVVAALAEEGDEVLGEAAPEGDHPRRARDQRPLGGPALHDIRYRQWPIGGVAVAMLALVRLLPRPDPGLVHLVSPRIAVWSSVGPDPPEVNEAIAGGGPPPQRSRRPRRSRSRPRGRPRAAPRATTSR